MSSSDWTMLLKLVFSVLSEVNTFVFFEVDSFVLVSLMHSKRLIIESGRLHKATVTLPI